ncbi:MAG: hypothetical protein IH897_13755 [Planctomycetes bacterium]|nr:hypothetical protein [Planctomycetota bacterium]
MPAKTDGKRQGARRFKIDGIVACILALDGVMQNESGGSVYDKRGLLWV